MSHTLYPSYETPDVSIFFLLNHCLESLGNVRPPAAGPGTSVGGWRSTADPFSREGDACLRAPAGLPRCPCSPVDRWNNPSGPRENVQEMSPCLASQGHRWPPRRRAEGLSFSAELQPDPKWPDHLILPLPLLWLRCPPSPVSLQEPGSRRRTEGHMQSAAPSSARLSLPRVLLPWPGVLGATISIPCKHPHQGRAGVNKAQVGEERAGRGGGERWRHRGHTR